jgi:HmuY protein
MRFTRALSLLILVSCQLPACGDDDTDEPTQNAGGAGGKTANAGSSAGAGGSTTTKSDAGSSTASGDVPCTDQSIMQLHLFDTPSTGAVADESNQDGVIQTFIDATAAASGGTEAKAGFVYGRFTDDGFERVNLSDYEAFDSKDWDIAVRRYVIRLNSGVSGPSTVTGARTKADTLFADVTEAPTDLPYRTEQYFTDDCTYVNDGTGINSPATALASFWSYQSCLAMTHNVYVLELANSRHVKLEVMAYYTLNNQKTCDETGQVPMPTGAGNIRFRWAFLD